MFILARTVTYATLFVGLVLVFLPGRVLSSSGNIQPPAIGAWQVAGMLLGAVGAALALSCILTFVFVGRGTPAPFDPPRRLVIRGPYEKPTLRRSFGSDYKAYCAQAGRWWPRRRTDGTTSQEAAQVVQPSDGLIPDDRTQFPGSTRQ